MQNSAYKKVLGIFIAGLLLPSFSSYAYDLKAAAALINAQDKQQQEWQEAQQQLRETRLQEWKEQKEADAAADAWRAAHPQPQPVMHNVNQNTAYKAPVPEPEADDLFAAALNGNVDQIRRLVSQGLDINVSNQERETALHMAASRGHYSTVIYLVNNGAYVNARTVKNWIPLHHAVRFRHPNIANFLKQHGSQLNTRTSDGFSAIDMAGNMKNYRLLSILGAR